MYGAQQQLQQSIQGLNGLDNFTNPQLNTDYRTPLM